MIKDDIPNYPRRPWVAFLLGLSMTGLGQIYNGSLVKGLVFVSIIMITAFLLGMAWSYILPSLSFLVIIFLAAITLHVGCAVLAYRQSRQVDPQLRLEWYCKPIGLIVIYLFFSFIVTPIFTGTIRYFIQSYKVPASSMIPTIEIGDHISIKKAYYGIKLPLTDQIIFNFKSPRRGDIVVFKYPEDETKDFIKRVIGLPGDVVEIKEKIVYINGKPLDEPYVIHKDPSILPKEFQPRDNLDPIIVPQDSFFMMGDNRDHSLDSRFWGFVRLNKIKGKVFVIYWSCKEKSSLACLVDLNRARWDRIGMVIE